MIFKFRRHWTIENLLTAQNEYIYCQCALGNFDWGKIGSRRFQAQGTCDFKQAQQYYITTDTDMFIFSNN